MKEFVSFVAKCLVIWPLLEAMHKLWPAQTNLEGFVHWLLFTAWWILFISKFETRD